MTDTSTQTLSKNKLKSQLRNLERKLLKFKSTMHANEIVETERKVNTLRHQLTSFTSTTPSTVELNLNKKSKCYYQYKAVRFIERVKTVRRIKQFEKENDLEKLNQAKLDLCYVMHFPESEKYISLYPTTPLSSESLTLQKKIQLQIQDQIHQGQIQLDTMYQKCVHPEGPKKRTKSKKWNEEVMQHHQLSKQIRGQFLESDSDYDSDSNLDFNTESNSYSKSIKNVMKTDISKKKQKINFT